MLALVGPALLAFPQNKYDTQTFKLHMSKVFLTLGLPVFHDFLGKRFLTKPTKSN